MKIRLYAFGLGLFLLAAVRSQATDNTYVRFNTSFGNIDVLLYSTESPNNVANFLTYVDSGAYTNALIHRSVPSFVIQGGGYDIVNNSIGAIPANSPVVGEHVVSNTLGTLAMALSTGPNSATNQWFFNEVDNSSLLDGTNDGGPFTAFGVVANSASLAVMDQIASVTPFDASTALGSSVFNEIPLQNYNPKNPIELSNLVVVNSITRLSHPAFFSGEVQLPNPSPTATQLKNSDFYYLQFGNGTVFGYYNDNYFPFIYHTTLGWEYVDDGGNGQVYLFDNISNHFWYTSSTLYPYVYDFTLNAWLFYDTTSSVSKRYFFNTSTNSWFTQ